MTIIVFRDGVLAADSQITTGGIFDVAIKKIAANKAGWLGGSCGDLGAVSAFAAWIERGNKKLLEFEAEDKFEGILINPLGAVLYVEKHGRKTPMSADYYTLGSGGNVALGALAHGATAIEAVEIAIKLVTSCGGPIHHIRHKLSRGQS